MNENRILSGAALQLSASCSFCTIAYIFLQDKSLSAQFYPLAMLLYAPVIYGINLLFLRRSRSAFSLAIFNAVLIVVFFLAALFSSEWESVPDILLAGLFCIWLGWQGARLAYTPPNLRQMILSLDSSVVVLLSFSVCVSMLGASLLWIVPAAAGCATAVLGVVGHRISRSLTGKEWLVIALGFFGVFAVMWAVAFAIAEPTGNGVIALWHFLVSAFSAAISAVWKLFLLFFSLFPDSVEVGETNFQIVSEEVQHSDGVAMTSLGELIILIVCGLLVLFVFIRALKKLKSVWLSRPRAIKTKAVRRQRVSLWQGLCQLARRFPTWLRVRRYLRKNRNTPQGVYFILVRRCRMTPWKKRRSETPREFLLRLRGAVGNNDRFAAALDRLLPALEASLFGPMPGRIALSDARQLRRGSFASAWLCKLFGQKEYLQPHEKRAV